MEIRIPVIVQDQLVALRKGMDPFESIEISAEIFLDGPISERVAVLDFDEDGGLRNGTRFKAPADGEAGAYQGGGGDRDSDSTIQVNVFGVVHRTLALFEEPDALGRQVDWAFDGPQLLVVPRAGKLANAFYERDSRSLQFFSFESARANYAGVEILTSLSHDIVAHETAHAILDGIAPDLYNALSPQALALHEAIADLAALLTALRSETLRETVLRQTGGSLDRSTAFSDIAEEFGVQRAASGPLRPLRSMLNDAKLPDSGGLRSSPHALSEVLTGALYTVFVRMYEQKRKKLEDAGSPSAPAAETALSDAAQHFKRMILRALDYLPPGEVSFADYGRAIIAADEASHPTWGRERGWIATEFVRRNMVKKRDVLLDLQPAAGTRQKLEKAIAALDLETLAHSDWAAYEFARENRAALGIPATIPIRVRPRLDVTKKYLSREGGTRDVRELIFKVSWDEIEKNPKARGLPPNRQITVGTMLAIDWETKRVRALLPARDATRARRDRAAHNRDRQDRDETLLRLLDEGRLAVGPAALGPDGHPSRSTVTAEVADDLLRVRHTARMLHIDPLEVDGVG